MEAADRYCGHGYVLGRGGRGGGRALELALPSPKRCWIGAGGAGGAASGWRGRIGPAVLHRTSVVMAGGAKHLAGAAAQSVTSVDRALSAEVELQPPPPPPPPTATCLYA